MRLLETMAREIYACHKFKREWDHPETQRIWHSTCYREARAALRGFEKFVAEQAAKKKAAA